MSDSVQAIYDYLEANQEAFHESQAEFLRKKKELFAIESVVFHSDISEQYEDCIKSNITNEICKRLALDYETVYNVVDSIDMEQYLSSIY